MEAISVVVALTLGMALGVGLSAMGLHLLLSFLNARLVLARQRGTARGC